MNCYLMWIGIFREELYKIFLYNVTFLLSEHYSVIIHDIPLFTMPLVMKHIEMNEASMKFPIRVYIEY